MDARPGTTFCHAWRMTARDVAVTTSMEVEVDHLESGTTIWMVIPTQAMATPPAQVDDAGYPTSLLMKTAPAKETTLLTTSSRRREETTSANVYWIPESRLPISATSDPARLDVTLAAKDMEMMQREDTRKDSRTGLTLRGT